MVTLATAAVGNRPFQACACASSADGRPHSAHTIRRRGTEQSPILWQAGVPLIITGTDVDDVCSMGEAVDHGFREAGVRKHLGPLAERDTIIDTRPLRSLITWSTSSAAPAGKAK